jgi:hypothetical protein
MLNNPVSEKIETLTYAPGLQGGTDLEAATKTISATSEQAGADYTTNHTIAAPADIRIVPLRGCMRLKIRPDSVGGGCTTLYWRVKRGGVSVATGSFAVAAAPLDCLISWDITTLITGAQTNTLFLWVDAGTCVISEVTMWTGVGTRYAGGRSFLSISHVGEFQLGGEGMDRVGTGNFYFSVGSQLSQYYTGAFRDLGNATNDLIFSELISNHYIANGIIYLTGGFLTVATDISYLTECSIMLVGRG